jgi:hypothetical protein
MSFRTMKMELQSFIPELSAIQLGLRINRSYSHILDLHPWSFLKRESLLTTYPPYDTGTATVTNGSITITGSGTNWTAELIGRFFRCNTQSSFYRITAVDSNAQTLTLELPYNGSNITADYIIFQHQYPKPTDAKNVLSVRYQYLFPNVSKTFIDQLDPDCISTGQPTYWLDIDDTTLELWPIPDQAYTLRLWYNRRISDLVNENDTSLIPERVVLAHAKMAAYMQMIPARKEYGQLYQLAQNEYQELLQAAIEEDMRKLSLPRRVVTDEDSFPVSADYWMQHDVLDPRRWNI